MPLPSNATTQAKTLKGRRDVLKTFDLAASRRAIYIDYEGSRDAEPTLLGWQWDGAYGASIVDRSFDVCARHNGAKEADPADHTTVVRSLVDRAVVERRHIVSWSVHDLKIMHGVLDRQGRERLLSCYVNALDIARPWHRREMGCTAPGGARLAYFAVLFEVKIPVQFGEQVVGSNLSALRKLFAAGRHYGTIGTAGRKRWATVVKHNKWDLRAMYRIVTAIRPLA